MSKHQKNTKTPKETQNTESKDKVLADRVDSQIPTKGMLLSS